MLSKRYESTEVDRRTWKFYGRYGNLIKQYEAPSPECYTTFWRITIYSDTMWSIDQALHQFWPYYWSWPNYRIWLLT